MYEMMEELLATMKELNKTVKDLADYLDIYDAPLDVDTDEAEETNDSKAEETNADNTETPEEEKAVGKPDSRGKRKKGNKG